ncbi:hypothetical protein [Sulfurimonas sp.]|uniref:hypothetical protein n=1 Tax=Sulfurimonas sp. TaxID=2022749 RepID=UPI0025F76CAB|nr:hypothetical protein [Sulfurimonas sp.]
MKKNLNITPIGMYPWFIKYLNGGQINVLATIISYTDYDLDNPVCIVSNRLIAFHSGFSKVQDTDSYQALDDIEKINLKNKKINSSIQYVKTVKRQLEQMGVIKRQVIDSKSYVTVNMDWNKSKFLKEFDERFN